MFNAIVNKSPGVYPGSIPEFRYFQKNSGEKLLQVRYMNHQIGYTGKWQDIPIEFETNDQGIQHGHSSQP